MIEFIKELSQKKAQTVFHIPMSDIYKKNVELIVEHAHRHKGKLVTSGKAGQIVINITTTFYSTEITSMFLHPSKAQHCDLGIPQPNDLLLTSNSDKNCEIVGLTQLTRNLSPTLKYIDITGPNSLLAHEAAVYFSTGNPKKVCTLDMTSTTLTTVMTAIDDTLVV